MHVIRVDMRMWQDRSEYIFVPRSLGMRLRATVHLTRWYALLLNQVCAGRGGGVRRGRGRRI
jgi:hypothetical protein